MKVNGKIVKIGHITCTNFLNQSKIKIGHKGRFEFSWSCWDGGLRTEIVDIGREIDSFHKLFY